MYDNAWDNCVAKCGGRQLWLFCNEYYPWMWAYSLKNNSDELWAMIQMANGFKCLNNTNCYDKNGGNFHLSFTYFETAYCFHGYQFLFFDLMHGSK